MAYDDIPNEWDILHSKQTNEYFVKHKDGYLRRHWRAPSAHGDFFDSPVFSLGFANAHEAIAEIRAYISRHKPVVLKRSEWPAE